jgi:hypothetical protein
MTLITFHDGKPVLRDGKVGTEQECCCGSQCLTCPQECDPDVVVTIDGNVANCAIDGDGRVYYTWLEISGADDPGGENPCENTPLISREVSLYCNGSAANPGHWWAYAEHIRVKRICDVIDGQIVIVDTEDCRRVYGYSLDGGTGLWTGTPLQHPSASDCYPENGTITLEPYSVESTSGDCDKLANAPPVITITRNAFP